MTAVRYWSNVAVEVAMAVARGGGETRVEEAVTLVHLAARRIAASSSSGNCQCESPACVGAAEHEAVDRVATAVAAHMTLSALFPSQQPRLDAALTAARIPATGAELGLVLGRAVAVSVLGGDFSGSGPVGVSDESIPVTATAGPGPDCNGSAEQLDEPTSIGRSLRRARVEAVADPGLSDGELVVRAATGDSAAWSLLVKRHGPRLWALARSYRLGDSGASDVVQTAWMNLLGSISSLRNPDAVGGWLTTAVKREALRAKGRISRQEPQDELPEPGVVFDVSGDLFRRGQLDALADAVGQLSDRCRQFLLLLFSEDRASYASISEALGLAIGSVGPTRGRCLDELREILRMNPYFGELTDPE